MSGNESTWEAVIDRIEESIAVILMGPDEVKIELPTELLPSEAEEGSILSVNFRLNKKATQSQRDKISSLIEDLKKQKGDL
jgi:hypothetical protein